MKGMSLTRTGGSACDGILYFGAPYRGYAGNGPCKGAGQTTSLLVVMILNWIRTGSLLGKLKLGAVDY